MQDRSLGWLNHSLYWCCPYRKFLEVGPSGLVLHHHLSFEEDVAHDKIEPCCECRRMLVRPVIALLVKALAAGRWTSVRWPSYLISRAHWSAFGDLSASIGITEKNGPSE